MLSDTGYHTTYARTLLGKHGHKALVLPWEQLEALVGRELAPFCPSERDIEIVTLRVQGLVRDAALPLHRPIRNLRQNLFGKEPN